MRIKFKDIEIRIPRDKIGNFGYVETLKKVGGQGDAPLGLTPPHGERGGHLPNSL